MTDYPDFTVIARLKGEYAGAEKSVVLDSEGALQALLYGTYSGANKKILIDTDGNVRMNLYAQDLDEMVNRFKYGSPDSLWLDLNMDNGVYDEMFDLTGKGYVYFGNVYMVGYASHKNDAMRLTADSEIFTPRTFYNLELFHFVPAGESWSVLRVYDDISFRYRAALAPGWTFESKYKLEYKRVSADDCSIYVDVAYTFIT